MPENTLLYLLVWSVLHSEVTRGKAAKLQHISLEQVPKRYAPENAREQIAIPPLFLLLFVGRDEPHPSQDQTGQNGKFSMEFAEAHNGLFVRDDLNLSHGQVPFYPTDKFVLDAVPTKMFMFIASCLA